MGFCVAELGLGHCERIAVDAEQQRVFVASDSGCVCCYDALNVHPGNTITTITQKVGVVGIDDA